MIRIFQVIAMKGDFFFFLNYMQVICSSSAPSHILKVLYSRVKNCLSHFTDQGNCGTSQINFLSALIHACHHPLFFSLLSDIQTSEQDQIRRCSLGDKSGSVAADPQEWTPTSTALHGVRSTPKPPPGLVGQEKGGSYKNLIPLGLYCELVSVFVSLHLGIYFLDFFACSWMNFVSADFSKLTCSVLYFGAGTCVCPIHIYWQ